MRKSFVAVHRKKIEGVERKHYIRQGAVKVSDHVVTRS